METANQQNILLVICEDGMPIDEQKTINGCAVMRWTKDIIKRGAHLTKTDVLCVSQRLLKAFKDREKTKENSGVVEILLADEYDENDIDSENEDSDEQPLEGADPLLCTTDYDRDPDKEIGIIFDLIDYCQSFEFDPERLELRIKIDNALDQSGELRRLLWGHVSDVRLSQDDAEYIIREEVQQKRRLDRTDPPKPCYYPSQEYAASAIIKRIRFIFDHYHDHRELESFTEFDFRIYTARSNMLEDQTLSRLCDRRAQCFSADEYEDERSLLAKAKQRVRKYVIRKDTQSELKSLEQEVVNNPYKLFLIVADEAHWGISSSTKLHRTGANNMLINTWNHDDHQNVIVLLVTATPWNLLTENSRLPKINVAEALTDGKFIVVDVGQHDLRHRRMLELGTERDVANEVGPVKELHVFKWSENFEIYMKRGLVLSLRVPERTIDNSIYLSVDDSSSEVNFYSVTGTTDSEQARSFLFKGANGLITVTTEDGLLTLTVRDGKVGFVNTDSCQVGSTSIFFKVHMNHGEDVLELESVCTEAALNRLKYIYRSKTIELGPRPVDNTKMAADSSYCFLIEHQKQFDEFDPVCQYLSLNFYYNSIRNEATGKQLIRSDNEVNAMFMELKPTGIRRQSTEEPAIEGYVSGHTYDDILAAEYAYYVVLINPIRRTFRTGHLLQSFEIWNLYADERDKILENVRLKLEKRHKVSSRVFQHVVDYIEKKAWDKIQKTPHRVKNWSRENSEIFVVNMIGYLLHANVETLTEQYAETWQRFESVQHLIEEHILDMTYEEIVTEVLFQSETFRIINDLIQTESDVEDELDGHMKVFRASDIVSGNRFYSTLTLARKIGSEGENCFFEVIRYFDALKLSDHEINRSVYRIWQTLQRKKCNNFSASQPLERCDCKEYVSNNDSIDCQHCRHPHNMLKHFSDLDRLPCILIIVENGRMGDTFPPSFNVMDLRARQTSKPTLSSLQQEIGRLCRYQVKSDYSQIGLPYVLVAPKLMTEFKKSMATSPDLRTSFQEKNLDAYTRRRNSKKQSSGRNNFEPNQRNYDYENTVKHNNRLLLQAEPQIGKTGVFLKVISLLRQIITKQIDLEETYSSEDSDDSDAEESSSEDLFASDWQFPYWETMAKNKPLKQEITGSKYDRIFGPYIYKKPLQHCKNATPPPKRPASTRQAVIPEDSPFRLFSRSEHIACTDCLSSATTMLKEWKIKVGLDKMLMKISVPRLRRFQKVFDKLNATLEEQERQALDEPNTQAAAACPTLNTWIFNPTYRRASTATVNYHHSMNGSESNTSCLYVQILVVRSEDFADYCELWQTTHAILQLPDTLPDCDVDVNTGGIGFARRAIQMFAMALGLDYIFLLDDNIYQISSVKFFNSLENSKQIVERTSEGRVKFEGISLYTVLKQLESLFDCEQAPKQNFLPYNYQPELPACQCNRSEEDLHFYTGPSEKYGVLGIRKYRPDTQPVRRGFKKTHVYSFVLLNIRALQEQRIVYNAWPVREDCNLNNDCDVSGLHVCKFNRFVLYKKPLKSLCFPKMYFWPHDVELLKINHLQKATSSAETTLHWIRLVAPPKRLEIMNKDCKEKEPLRTSEIKKYLYQKPISAEYFSDDRRKGHSDLRVILNGLLKTSIGKSHLVVCLNDTAEVKDIHHYFQKSKGIGNFKVHLVVFPVFLCHRIQITKVEHYKKKIIDPIFDDETEFDVVTSHNITEFSVPIVIVYIRGNIKNPLDRTKIGNVGLPEMDENPVLQRQHESNEIQKSAKGKDDQTGSKRRESKEEGEDQRSPKRMRPNDDQANERRPTLDIRQENPNSMNSTEATFMMPANGQGLSVIPNQMEDQLRFNGAHTNPSAVEKTQESDICSLEELLIYDRRTNSVRPLQRGTTLAADEEVLLIAKPSGRDLSARVHEIVSAAFDITRAQ